MPKLVHICSVCKREFDPNESIDKSRFYRIKDIIVSQVTRYEDITVESKSSFDLCNECSKKLINFLNLDIEVEDID